MDIKKVLKDAEAAITTYEWLAVTEFDATTVVDSEDVRKVLYEALAAQLDAIIAEMEKDVVFYTEHAEGKYDLEMQDPTVYAERKGARNYANGRLEWLKEARLSLSEDGGCKELNNNH